MYACRIISVLEIVFTAIVRQHVVIAEPVREQQVGVLVVIVAVEFAITVVV